jgi:hypothetical protein
MIVVTGGDYADNYTIMDSDDWIPMIMALIMSTLTDPNVVTIVTRLSRTRDMVYRFLGYLNRRTHQ